MSSSPGSCTPSSPASLSLSFSFLLTAHLHLEQVHVDTGGPSSYVSFHWAEWLSFDVPLQERLAVGAGTHYCFLSSIQASPSGTPFPRIPLSWSAIDYVSEFICMNILCLSSALHSSDEEMLIQLCPEAVNYLPW